MSLDKKTMAVEPFEVIYDQMVTSLLNLALVGVHMKSGEFSKSRYESFAKGILKQHIAKLLMWENDEDTIFDGKLCIHVFDNFLIEEDVTKMGEIEYVRVNWSPVEKTSPMTVDVENITYDMENGELYCEGWKVFKNGNRSKTKGVEDMFIEEFSLSDCKKLLYNILLPLCQYYKPTHETFGVWGMGGNGEDSSWFQWLTQVEELI